MLDQELDNSFDIDFRDFINNLNKNHNMIIYF